MLLYLLINRYGAVEKTRTSTGSLPQRPQRCASTNSATTAYFGFHLVIPGGTPEITNLSPCCKGLYTEKVMRTSQKTINFIEWRRQFEPIAYLDGLNWMDTRVKAIQKKEAHECAWFLEHPSLYTLGTSGHDKDILSSAKFPVFKTGRGGQVTYHGPGQRVVYLMLDLNTRYRDIHRYIFDLEDWLITTLAHFKVKGERRQGRVGIWVHKEGLDHKIAALGIRVQKWVTSHGIALNINPDLMAYQNIIPCGLRQYGITSLSDLGLSLTMQEVDDVLMKTFPFHPCV